MSNVASTSTGRPITVSASLNEVRAYFGIPSAAKFAVEWKPLTEQDKADLKSGIGDGSLTY